MKPFFVAVSLFVPFLAQTGIVLIDCMLVARDQGAGQNHRVEFVDGDIAVVSARNLRTGQTGIIGLAIPDLQMPYFAQLSSLVIDIMEHRLPALLCCAGNINEWEESTYIVNDS